MKTAQIENIQEVWDAFFETKDDYYRNLLMENYLRIVEYTADRVYAKLPKYVEMDDLIGAGVFGLMDAISAFDPERGVKFETYCSPRIKGAILDELRRMDWVPRLARAREHVLESALNTLEAHLGRTPTHEETMAELGIGHAEYSRVVGDAAPKKLVSLVNDVGKDDGKGIYIQDIIENKASVDPYEDYTKKEMKDFFIKGLSRKEKLVLILYYHEDFTMKEIGYTLDLSESRISQMHSSLLDRLKARVDHVKEDYLGRETSYGPKNPRYLRLADIIMECGHSERRAESIASSIKQHPFWSNVVSRWHQRPDMVHSANISEVKDYVQKTYGKRRMESNK